MIVEFTKTKLRRADCMNENHLSLPRLAGFSLGLFAVQTFWGFTWTTLPLYLKEIVNSNTVTGIMLSTTGVTGMVLPVLSGMVSDRISTPLGRRRPLIGAGWILACMMLALMPGATTIGAALPLIVLAYAGFFLSIGPYFALLPDIVPPTQRGFASGVMFFIGGMGMLSYLVFAARLWDASHARPFYWAMAAVAISVAIMCVTVREPEKPAQSGRRGNVLAEAFRERNTALFLSGMTLWWIGIWMVSAFFVITCKALFGVSTARAVQAFFILNASFVLFALPAGLLAGKFGLKPVTVAGLVLLVVCFFVIPLLNSYRAMLPFMVVAGAGYGTILAVSYPLFLRLVPEGKTAGYVGLYMASQNGTLLAGPALGGVLIDRFGYFAHFSGAAAFILAGMALLIAARIPEAHHGIPAIDNPAD